MPPHVEHWTIRSFRAASVSDRSGWRISSKQRPMLLLDRRVARLRRLLLEDQQDIHTAIAIQVGALQHEFAAPYLTWRCPFATIQTSI